MLFRSRTGGVESVFYGILFYGVPVLRTEYICRVGAVEAGGVLLASSKSDHCCSADSPSAAAWVGSARCVPGGAYFQCDRGEFLLHSDVSAGVSKAAALIHD